MPSDVRYFSLSSYDLIVALENDAAEVLSIPSRVRFEAWAVADPWDRPQGYVACCQVIERKLRRLGSQLGLVLKGDE
jgi:protein-tyrosine-phosphatase